MKTRKRKVQANPGDRYGQLEIIEEIDADILSGKPSRKMLCRCDCGTEKAILFKSLRSGATQSCGCLHDTLPIKHGHAQNGRRSSAYRSWSGMRDRCLRLGSTGYDQYGGRGITICDRWSEFAAFLEDMGEPPTDRHSIDRRDTNGNYTPDNCRWATPKQQGRNRRNNRMLTHDGKTLCIAEWAELTGISQQAMKRRIDVCGYSVAEALTIPLGVKRDGR